MVTLPPKFRGPETFLVNRVALHPEFGTLNQVVMLFGMNFLYFLLALVNPKPRNLNSKL